MCSAGRWYSKVVNVSPTAGKHWDQHGRTIHQGANSISAGLRHVSVAASLSPNEGLVGIRDHEWNPSFLADDPRDSLAMLVTLHARCNLAPQFL